MQAVEPQVKRRFPQVIPLVSGRPLLNEFVAESLADGCLMGRRFGPNAEWLSVAEVARRLGLSELTVRRLVNSGALKGCRVGRSIRIRRDDLETYLRSRPARPQPKAAKCGAEVWRQVGELGRLQLGALAELERLAPRRRGFDFPEGFEVWPQKVQHRWIKDYHALYFDPSGPVISR